MGDTAPTMRGPFRSSTTLQSTLKDGHRQEARWLSISANGHGNYADVMAMAEAHGAGSLSATLTNALTFENHFSFVNAMGMVAV